MFCEESFAKIEFRAFRNVSVHEFYRFKALITLTSEHYWSKKKELKKLPWSGVVNFHCMHMALVMSMRFIFGDD